MNFRRQGWPSIVPRIITPDVTAAASFIKTVFNATGEVHETRPTELWIGDSVIMISDGGGRRDSMPGFLYVYVPDTDETYRRALAEGATPIEEPAIMPWGDRRATVRDRWDNIWQIATCRG